MWAEVQVDFFSNESYFSTNVTKESQWTAIGSTA